MVVGHRVGVDVPDRLERMRERIEAGGERRTGAAARASARGRPAPPRARSRAGAANTSCRRRGPTPSPSRVTSLPVPEVVGTAISVLTRCGVKGLPVASSGDQGVELAALGADHQRLGGVEGAAAADRDDHLALALLAPEGAVERVEAVDVGVGLRSGRSTPTSDAPTSVFSRGSRPKPSRLGEGDDAGLPAAQHRRQAVAGRRRRSAPRPGCDIANGPWRVPWARAGQAAWFSARSKTSKLRSRRDGSTSLQRPVEEQRHVLLGEAAVRAQRRVEPREVVARRAGADHVEPLGDDDDVADPVGRQLELRRRFGAREHDLDAAAACAASPTGPPGRRPPAGRRWRTSRASRGGRRRGRSPAGSRAPRRRRSARRTSPAGR